MVRNIVILGGNSHPELVDSVCSILGIPQCNRTLGKFSCGESRCEIQDSVRGKDVFIIQTGFGGNGGRLNDHFMDLCIMISACKTGSARRVTAVLPLFPYSRQPDLPYNKAGAPLYKAPADFTARKDYTFESVPATPAPGVPRSAELSNGADLSIRLGSVPNGASNGNAAAPLPLADSSAAASTAKSETPSSEVSVNAGPGPVANGASSVQANSVNGGYEARTPARTAVPQRKFTTHDYENTSVISAFTGRPGYKQWVAQAGTLVADLLTCAGADHVITMDLHDPQVQGYFDIPVDNLYGKPLIQGYLQHEIPNFKEAVIISPDAGGAKRATAIADSLGMDFALIHKERRPTKITERQNASMMLVGNVTNRVCVLVDDLLDTGNTITRAAKLLRKEGATTIYVLITHGVFSGDAISRINASDVDKIVVTNSVPQDEHRAMLGRKLEVLNIAPIFAEAVRRVHHGESISVLFNYD